MGRFWDWLRPLAISQPSRSARPELESLEDRCLLSGNPVANNTSYTMLHDQVLIADGQNGDPSSLQSDISDTTGNPLTTVLVTGPSNGSLSLSSDGAFVYVPNAGYVGSDSFQFQAFDGSNYSNTATVSIKVTDHYGSAELDAIAKRLGSVGHILRERKKGN